MENDRNPNRHIGNWHVDVRKILCRPGRIAQLEDAVPDEKARHQQARKQRQIGFHGVHGSSLLTSCPERASYRLKFARGKGAVQCVLGSTTGADPKPFALSLCYQIARKKLLDLKNRRASWPHRAHADIQHHMLTVSRRFFVQNLAFHTGAASPLYSREPASSLDYPLHRRGRGLPDFSYFRSSPNIRRARDNVG